MKVLAVDDSISITTFIKDVLSLEKIDVETATNGAEALDKYAKHKHDIVTLDVSMPIMDGYETLTKILQFDRNAKVIMITTSEHWSLIQRCLDKGAVGYISKPFSSLELVNTIKDPWFYDDKNIVAFFSITANKIQNTLQKLLDTDVNILLKNLNVGGNSTTHTTSGSKYGTIIAVAQIVSKEAKKISPSTICFGTSFVGSSRGMILSVMNKGFSEKMIKMTPYFNKNDIDATKEFFYTINSKIFSTVVDYTNRILNMENTLPYEEIDQNLDFPQVITANFEIAIQGLNFPLEIQIWSDSGLLTRRRF